MQQKLRATVGMQDDNGMKLIEVDIHDLSAMVKGATRKGQPSIGCGGVLVWCRGCGVNLVQANTDRYANLSVRRDLD